MPTWCLIMPSGFVCGVYCNYDSNGFVFAVLIFPNHNATYDSILRTDEMKVVWSANRNSLVSKNATLQLTEQGDLVLKEADGTTAVWSTNTCGKSVVGLNLTETGNLMLFDSNNETVWQSFDHPTDSLLPEQRLVSGQKLLTASLATDNWTEGMLSLSVTNEALVAYVESNPPQIYYLLEGSDTDTKGKTKQNYILLGNESLDGFIHGADPNYPDSRIFIATDLSAQFIKLGPDGHLRAYGWKNNSWEAADLLTDCCPPPSANGTNYFRPDSIEFEEDYLDQVSGMPTRFSFQDLKSTTQNFSCKLGEGGFGSVYEGTLSNGVKVAVKHLEGLAQVKKSFSAEVETIGSIHHVNLVRLIGFCAEKSHRLLVYEYMCNGSLDKWIFHKNQHLSLGWESRRKIILDIAKGLAYLHEECRQKIFHLDIKPQNILLDEHLNAKVSDFGLSKLIDKDQSQVVTTMRGTPGYLAPEWLSSVITEKVDVYSFGVVLLEILCGRRNVDRSQPEEDMHLLGIFRRKANEGQVLDMVDKNSEDMQRHGAEVMELMKVAAWCLQNDYARRPSMSVVVKALEGLVDIEDDLIYNFSYSPLPRGIAHKPGLSFCSFLLLQVLTEYILVSVTSAVTVTIAGVVKEAVTILVAVFYFHDQFTWLKGVGLFTIMVGVSLFNWYKYLKLQTGHSNEVDMGDAAGDIAGSLKSNINARYVILEEVDEQEDST
ncbi:unnamed protein product, partial [Vitis vinifera]